MWKNNRSKKRDLARGMPTVGRVLRQYGYLGLAAWLVLAGCTAAPGPASATPAAAATATAAATVAATAATDATATPAGAGSATPAATANTTTPAANVTAGPTASAADNGCPEQQAPAIASAAPDVVLGVQGAGGSSSASLNVGQVLEVRLGAGMRWSLKLDDPAGVLAPAEPNGWFDTARPGCVWRFTGHAPGTVSLNYSGRAICKPGAICPNFVLGAAFEVTVKG